ncbi:MAG: dockerin type I domain-containing protein [Planctomycetota bacterium]
MRKSKNRRRSERSRRSKRLRRNLIIQNMESRRLLAGDGLEGPIADPGDLAGEFAALRESHNHSRPTDVNDDLATSALDALLVINYLNANEIDFVLDGSNERVRFLDVNNDGLVTPLDALRVINFLISNDHDSVDDDPSEGPDLDSEDELEDMDDEREFDEDALDEDDDGDEDDAFLDDELEEEPEDVGDTDELDDDRDCLEDHDDADDPDDMDEPEEVDDPEDEEEPEEMDDSEDMDDTEETDDSSDTDSGSDTNTNPFNLQIDAGQTGTTEGFEVRTNGIFAVWWDPTAGPIDPGADAVFALLEEVREDAMNNLGFSDPPNPEAGYFFNVFVHRGEDDRFPNFFGNGVGFEAPNDLPDLAIPEGLHDDRSNMLHEAYHIFQTSSSYEVVDTNPDAVWIIEGSAEWYQASRNPDDPRAFIVAGSPYALPHLPWWYTPGQEPEGVVDDNGWLYGVREYAMSSFLYYLTNIESVDPSVIAGVYTTNSDLTAQEYIFNEVGGDNLREMFADWAVRNAAGLDFLTEEQVDVALNELAAEATPDEIKNNVLELTDGEANGSFRPESTLTPGGWAYNSIKINNSQDTTYTIDVLGDATGSQGAASHFEARVAVVNGGATTYYDIPMGDNLSGQFVLNATPTDSEVYVVIASVPDQLGGNQTYGYQVDISTGPA